MPEPGRVGVGVVLVDDHPMFAQSLARLLDDEADITVLSTVFDSSQALAQVEKHRPDVVLVDYNMAGQDGVQLAAEIRANLPGSKIIMLTGVDDDRVLLAALEAGCSGFITKDRAASEVVAAVIAVAAGEALISPALLARLLPRLSRGHREVGSNLTDREREILRMLAGGWTNAVIAARLHLSVHTVRNHVQSILAKLGVHSKLEAVSIGMQHRLIEPPTGRRAP